MSIGRMKANEKAVSATASATSVAKQLPRMRSAAFSSPWPIIMLARGAPPMPMRFAKADISMMSGKHTPSPVSAAAPSPGMWPMYMRSTTL